MCNLYHLTVENSKENQNTAYKRVSESGIIDIRLFKQQKKKSLMENDSQAQEFNDSMK